MKSISKNEKAYILAHCSKVNIKRTSHRFYVEELPEVLKLLENYKKMNKE